MKAAWRQSVHSSQKELAVDLEHPGERGPYEPARARFQDGQTHDLSDVLCIDVAAIKGNEKRRSGPTAGYFDVEHSISRTISSFWGWGRGATIIV